MQEMVRFKSHPCKVREPLTVTVTEQINNHALIAVLAIVQALFKVLTGHNLVTFSIHVEDLCGRLSAPLFRFSFLVHSRGI